MPLRVFFPQICKYYSSKVGEGQATAVRGGWSRGRRDLKSCLAGK